MAKQYAIIHVQKHSSTGGSLGNHIERTEGMKHTYPHAKPEMKNLTFLIIEVTKELVSAKLFHNELKKATQERKR